MRNLLAVARHEHRQVIAALIRTIFAQPDGATASAQLRQVVDQVRSLAPEVAERLQAAETDLLAYTVFPPGHWPKIWSNNPIERLDRELKRRTDVVQIFPNTESVIRLVGAISWRSTTRWSPPTAATSPPPPSPDSRRSMPCAIDRCTAVHWHDDRHVR